MTANWVTQTSFAPPMVAVAIENSSRTMGRVRDARHRAQRIPRRPARPRRQAGTLRSEQAEGYEARPQMGGPILTEALGWLECVWSQRCPRGPHWCSAR
jgi:flavin reductase (DIM6/NTAB) family NADH-FMN oxidoreductase RutF